MHYVSYWGGHNHFAFVGDSRIRQLYMEMVDLIAEKKEEQEELKPHHDLHFQDKRINIKIVSPVEGFCVRGMKIKFVL